MIMDMYPLSARPYNTEEFMQLFADPPAIFRGAPFWSWNGTLSENVLSAQIERFDRMGMGGAHAHVRTGLRTPYLSREYLDLVKAVADRQKSRGKLLWLYDEDRWPSGFAGGLVTKNHPEFRRMHLVLTSVPNECFIPSAIPLWHIQARRKGKGVLMARYALIIDGPRLSSMRRLEEGKSINNGETEWFAYLETTEQGTWFNNAGYVDAMNPAAISFFADITYDAYAQALSGHMGSTVPAIFTDEPQLSFVGAPEKGGEVEDHLLSWTGDFAATYRSRFGLDVLDDLPLIVWDKGDGTVSPARWRYHEHRAARFASAYAGTLGERARRHGIALSGHLMSEDRLEDQVGWNGESMRSYPHFDIPGIDLLCDDELPSTAKQAVSVARQTGKKSVLSELYGVTGWAFDFTGHKRQGDWQAALGITVRVPHLSWMTMAGEAKRDYPAAIDWHSPWWKEYKLVENHFSRLNTALTRGKAVVRVGMIHPVESTWQHYGPRDGSGAFLGYQEKLFQDLTRTLIENLTDFDYIAESLLSDMHQVRKDALFGIGEMAYDTVLIPACTTLRADTLAALKAFADRGGSIIVIGERATHVEGQSSEQATAWFDRIPSIKNVERLMAPKTIDTAELLAKLEPVREVRAKRSDGSPACRVYSQLRTDGDARWFFICDAEKSGTGQGPLRLAVKGSWYVERFDTLAGTSLPVEALVVDGWTEWSWDAQPCGSELVRLSSRTEPASLSKSNGLIPESRTYFDKRVTVASAHFAFHLEEPNVLVLDRACFRIGNGPWEGPHEVLRLDNIVRSRLGLPPVSGDIAQPWSEAPAPVSGSVDLRFTVHCDIAIEGAMLALEQLESSSISVDGVQLDASPAGFWVDESIATVVLPSLCPGIHEIVLTQEVHRDTTREWCYLLGKFGVYLDADRRGARLAALPSYLAPGDLVNQGLPFYAGNTVLEFPVELEQPGEYHLEIGPYKAPLVTVSVDGIMQLHAAFPPYIADLGWLEAGRHTLALTIFGNRANAFGPLHLAAGPDYKWLGPDAYRTTGATWSEAWQLKAHGLVSPPRLYLKTLE